MTMGKRRIIKWGVTGIVFAWAVVTFLLLAGEEDPNAPMPLAEFLCWKAVGVASLLLCCIAGRWLYRRGWIVEFDSEEQDDEQDYYSE